MNLPTPFPCSEPEVVLFGLEQIADLKREALAAPLKRARLCLHRSTADAIQEMIIALHKTSYVRPHRHPGKTESFHVLDGRLMVVLFDDEGAILGRLPLGPPASGRAVVYRLNASHWHTVLVEDEFAVFHETVGGPFDPTRTEFASWAPEPTAEKAVAYMKALRELTEEPRTTD
jgi:cupin fold WbuC family metalloprotein